MQGSLRIVEVENIIGGFLGGGGDKVCRRASLLVVTSQYPSGNGVVSLNPVCRGVYLW